jgi:hypothetical protein
MLFIADPNLRIGGGTMIIVDVLGLVMCVQAFLAVALFLFLQLLVLFVPGRLEWVADWVVYRGTWYGLIFQCLSIAVVAGLVFYAQTDHTRVTYTLMLILANAVWFTVMRLAFLVNDYREHRRMRRKEQ